MDTDTRIITTVFSFIVIATLFLFFCEKVLKKKIQNIWSAYFSTIIMVSLILIPAYFHPHLFLIVILFLNVFGTTELYRILSNTRHTPYQILGCIIGTILILISYFFTYSIALMFLICIVIIFLFHIWIHGKKYESFSTLLGLIYPGYCFSALVVLVKEKNGFYFVFFLYAILEIHDIFAYLFGKYFGRKKIWPRISPNKTYIGSFSGILGSILFGYLLWFLIPNFSFWELIMVSIMLAISGQLGDLFASILKRKWQVKDFGTIIPSQGGILDAYDALLFVAPLFYIIIRIFLV